MASANLVIPSGYRHLSYKMSTRTTENGTGLPFILNGNGHEPIPIRYVTPKDMPGRKQYYFPGTDISVFRTSRTPNSWLSSLLLSAGIRFGEYEDFGGAVAVAHLHGHDSEEFIARYAQKPDFEIGAVRSEKRYLLSDEELQAVFRRLFGVNAMMSFPSDEIMAYTFDPGQARPMIESIMQLRQEQEPNGKKTSRLSLDELLRNGKEHPKVVDVTPYEDAPWYQYELPDDLITVRLGHKIIRESSRFTERDPNQFEGSAATLSVHNPDLGLFLQKFVRYAAEQAGFEGGFGLVEFAEHYTTLDNAQRNDIRRMFGGELVSDNAYEVLAYTFDERQIRPMVDSLITLGDLVEGYHTKKEEAYKDRKRVITDLKSTSFYQQLKSRVQEYGGKISRERLTDLLREHVLDPYKRKIANSVLIHHIKEKIKESPEYHALTTAIKAAKSSEYRMQLWNNLLESHMVKGMSYSKAAERIKQSKVYEFVNRLTRGSLREGLTDVLNDIIDKYRPETLAPALVAS